MPAMEGRLDERGVPLIGLRLIPSPRQLSAIVDTGFDGELLVYYDDLRSIGVIGRRPAGG